MTATIAETCPTCEQVIPRRKLRLILYSFEAPEPKLIEVEHDDTSTLGLNVVAAVDGTMCKKNDDCQVCNALRRRIQSHVGL